MMTRLAPLTEQLSLQERTYQALRAALLNGDYVPGDRMFEATIAQALGVSRNPVREAVRRLQQDGLLEVRPHYGIYVASIPPDEIEDVYRIRGALEATAAALAAERMTDAEIRELGDIVAEQQAAAKTADATPRKPVSAAQADHFHHAIHLAARSPRLMTLLEQIYAQVTHFRNLTLRVPGRAAESAAGHARIYEAIRARDAVAADREMRLHIDDACQVLMRKVNESREPSDGHGPARDRRAPADGRRA
jgi:DNA-binding GntR family transcriptional regulator